MTPWCIKFSARSDRLPPVRSSPESRGSNRSQRRVNTARWEAKECSDWCTVIWCRRIDGSDDVFSCSASSSKNLRQSSSVGSDSLSAPESSGSDGAFEAFFGLAGLVCNSSAHHTFKSVCATGKDSNLSRRERRFSGTRGFDFGEEADNIGLSRDLLIADGWQGQKVEVALSVSQEEPSNVGVHVQPLRDKLIPHFCVKFVWGCLLGRSLPSALRGRARQQSVNDFLEMWHMKLRLR